MGKNETKQEKNEVKQVKDTFSDNLGDILSHERARTGKSDADIAKDMGIEKASLSKYKNSHQEIRASNLVKIAKYFGVSIDYLLGVPSIRSEAENVAIATEATGLPRQTIRTITDFDEKQTLALSVLISQPVFGDLLSTLYSCACKKAICDCLANWIKNESEYNMRRAELFALESAEPMYNIKKRELSSIPDRFLDSAVNMLSKHDSVCIDGTNAAKKELLNMSRQFALRPKGGGT